MLGIPLWSVVKKVGRNFFFMCKIPVYFQWDSTKVTALPTGQKSGEIGRMSLTREGFGVKLNRARDRTEKGEICTIFTSNFPTVKAKADNQDKSLDVLRPFCRAALCKRYAVARLRLQVHS